MRVAVIGGGIVAQAIALRLSDAGHEVTLIAPRAEPHMASTGNAGTIARYALDPVATPGVLRDTPRLLFNRDSPLAIHRPSALSLVPWLTRFLLAARPARVNAIRDSLADLCLDADTRWLGFAQRIGAGDLVRRGAATYAYDTPADIESARASLAPRIARGVQVEWFSAQDLTDAHPGLPQGRFAGGAGFADTLYLSDPVVMMERLTAAQGATRIDARVTGLTPQGNGWRVVHEQGDLHADRVVLAGGAWSGALLRPLGVRLPLTAERGYHLEFDLDAGAMPLSSPLCPATYGFYFTPMAGRLRAAGTVELGGIGAPPSPHRWEMLERCLRTVLPDLPPPARRWMGLRPSMPDSLPVIGPVRPGLLVAFGHGHIGLTLAPRTAALIEDALNGIPLPAAVSPARFRASGVPR